MNHPDEPLSSPRDDLESLSTDLLAAIQGARRRQATPAMVSQLTARLIPQPSSCPHPRREQPRWHPWAVAMTAIAMAAAITVIAWVPDNPTTVTSSRRNTPVNSAIRHTSLASTALERISQDLDLAESRLNESQESLLLAAIRREIQTTKEEFSLWSH